MKLQTRAPFHFHSDWMICIVLYVLWKLCPPPHISKTNFGRCNETEYIGYSNPSTAKIYPLQSHILTLVNLRKEEMCYECMSVCPDQRCCGFMWRALLPLFLSHTHTHTPGQWASASFFSSACSPLPDDIHTNLPFFFIQHAFDLLFACNCLWGKKIIWMRFFFLLSSIFLVHQRHMDLSLSHTHTPSTIEAFNNSSLSLSQDWNKPLNKSRL